MQTCLRLSAKSGPGAVSAWSRSLRAAPALVQRTVLWLLQLASPPPLAMFCESLTFEGGAEVMTVKDDPKSLRRWDLNFSITSVYFFGHLKNNISIIFLPFFW